MNGRRKRFSVESVGCTRPSAATQKKPAVQLVDIVPYLLEDVLKEQGAGFSATTNWGVYVVHDGC
jgi:hypothetical protein